MIDVEYYNESKLMVHPDFGEKYDGLVIRNSICCEHPIHMHDCIEIVYVSRGAVEYKVSFEQYVLRKGEFLVVNAYDMHQIKAITEDAIISCIHISLEKLSLSEEGLIMWWADKLKYDLEKYEKQVENIRNLIMQYENNEPARVIDKRIDDILRLFRKSFKVENFQLYNEHDVVEGSEFDIERLGEIYVYLYRHCNEKLTLETMANEFAMSKYYFSHFIKKMAGIGIQKMLNYVRCDRAEIALLGTNDTIEDIRNAFSFSSSQYFNEIFKSAFGLSPKMYREKYKKDTVIYRDFSEELIKDFDLLKTEKNEAAAEEKLIEIKLKESADRIITIETVDGEEVIKKYDVSNGQKMRIEYSSDDLIIFIKSNN